MEVYEVTPETYNSIINSPSHLFNSVNFSELNSRKCDKMYYLLFKDSKFRLGIILGAINNILLSPFSSSYGGFESLNNDIKLYQIDKTLEVLKIWANENGFKGISIICPPFFYGSNFFTKISNCLYRAGFEVLNSEINYHFETSRLTDKYLSSIWHNARKNFKKSQSHVFSFCKVQGTEAKEAYAIIAQNRRERGFPLKLTFEELQKTGKIIPIDYFVVNKSNQSVASAIVFHLSKDVVRVVYWGDLPEYSEYKTMNFLSYKVFEYFKQQGISYVDIGHSTVNSVPNHGLCEFKESIGCSLGPLYHYYISL